MIKVLFICHGNICRSAMAEAMFRDMVQKKGIEDAFVIDSAATSTEELGNAMYPPAVRKLKEKGIPTGNHRARQLRAEDYQAFDYLIGMDDANIRNMTRMCHGDPDEKIHLMLDYAGEHRSIADPWYSDNFEATYQDLQKGLEGFLETLGF